MSKTQQDNSNRDEALAKYFFTMSKTKQDNSNWRLDEALAKYFFYGIRRAEWAWLIAIFIVMTIAAAGLVGLKLKPNFNSFSVSSAASAMQVFDLA